MPIALSVTLDETVGKEVQDARRALFISMTMLGATLSAIIVEHDFFFLYRKKCACYQRKGRSCNDPRDLPCVVASPMALHAV